MSYISVFMSPDTQNIVVCLVFLEKQRKYSFKQSNAIRQKNHMNCISFQLRE